MKIEIDWQVKGVSVQDKVGDIVTRKGEFGYLPQERVDEIANQISEMNITLEQALSLRAALNQEKSVYSHSRLMRRSNELRRRYDDGESVLSLSKRFDAPPSEHIPGNFDRKRMVEKQNQRVVEITQVQIER